MYCYHSIIHYLSDQLVSLQLVAEREQVQKNRKQTHHLKQTMEGHVRHEKERFERLAKEMKYKEKDLAAKSDKLRQVQELIKNSPLVGTRSALRETTTPNVKAQGKVGVVIQLCDM